MTDRPILFSAAMVRAILDGTKSQTRRALKPIPYNREGCAVDINLAPTARFTEGADGGFYYAFDHPNGGPLTAHRARFAIGDRLWVRESWFVDHADCQDGPYQAPEGMSQQELKENGFLHFAATDDPNSWEAERPRWKPSIHMPRWASRLTLTVTDVRVERLQDISEADALAEGVPSNEDYIGSHAAEYCPKCNGSGVHGGFGANYGVIEVDCAQCETPQQRYRNLWNHINGPEAWDANPWVVAVSFTAEQRNIDQ